MHQTQTLASLDVTRATNMRGQLNAECRARLNAVIANPTEETWDDAYSLIVHGGSLTTLWEAVLRVDHSFPKTGPSEDLAGNRVEGWKRIPRPGPLASRSQRRDDN